MAVLPAPEEAAWYRPQSYGANREEEKAEGRARSTPWCLIRKNLPSTPAYLFSITHTNTALPLI